MEYLQDREFGPGRGAVARARATGRMDVAHRFHEGFITVCFGWVRAKLCAISSTRRRVTQPEAFSLAPSAYIVSSRAFPSSPTKVTSERSTATRPSLASGATLRQARANSSTHGPTSRPSTRTIVDLVFFSTVIFNMV